MSFYLASACASPCHSDSLSYLFCFIAFLWFVMSFTQGALSVLLASSVNVVIQDSLGG